HKKALFFMACLTCYRPTGVGDDPSQACRHTGRLRGSLTREDGVGDGLGCQKRLLRPEIPKLSVAPTRLFSFSGSAADGDACPIYALVTGISIARMRIYPRGFHRAASDFDFIDDLASFCDFNARGPSAGQDQQGTPSGLKGVRRAAGSHQHLPTEPRSHESRKSSDTAAELSSLVNGVIDSDGNEPDKAKAQRGNASEWGFPSVTYDLVSTQNHT